MPLHCKGPVVTGKILGEDLYTHSHYQCWDLTWWGTSLRKRAEVKRIIMLVKDFKEEMGSISGDF
jgi:hypothetical protein